MTTIPSVRSRASIEALVSAPGPATAFPELAPFAELIGALRAARGQPDAVAKVVQDPRYGELMALLWRNAQRYATSQDSSAQALLTAAAGELDVRKADLLYGLAGVTAGNVGRYIPATIAAELVGLQASEKPAWFPGTKKAEVPLTGVYSFAMKLVAPTQKSEHGLVRTALHGLAKVVHGWTDAASSEVRVRLRHIADAAQASGLKLKELEEIPEEAQWLVAKTAQAVQGSCVDADQFVTDVRSDSTDKTWIQRTEQWGLDRSADMGKILDAVAQSIDLFRDPAAWDASRLAIQVTAGVSAGTLKADAAAAGGTVWYLPSLGDLKEGKRESIRTVSMGASGAALALAGASAGVDSRGRSASVDPGWLVFSDTSFSSEIGLSVPGKFTVTMGNDQAYGPFAFAAPHFSPASVVGLIPFVGRVARPLVESLMHKIPGLHPFIGAGVQWHHPGFGPIEKWVHTLGAPVPAAVNSVKGAGSRLWRWATGHDDKKGKATNWPSDADWQAFLPDLRNGESGIEPAKKVAAMLASISPDQLLSTQVARDLLGDDAAKPAKTHATILKFIQGTVAALERDTAKMRENGARFLAQESVDRADVKKTAEDIHRQYHALAWIYDGLLGPLLKACAAPATGGL